MASNFAELEVDNLKERDASYNYRSNEVARPDLTEGLEVGVDGDVRFDTYS